MSNLDKLQQKLQQTLGKAAPEASPALLDLPAPDRPQGGSGEQRRGHKLSISLFDADMAKIQAVRQYMASHGSGPILTISEVIRLAIRLSPLSEALAVEYEKQQAEDGRRR